jgi:phosphatidate phosphatase APP1
MPDPARAHIAAYRGYGTPTRALVLARALLGARTAESREGDRWWKNALRSFHRMEADPLPHARVRVHAGASQLEVVADDEGFVDHWISLPASDAGAPPVRLTLDHPEVHRATADAQIAIPSPRARFGVISDLDDTVLRSEVGSRVRAARLMFLENALTRLPFPGVAALYRALTAGENDDAGTNPVFYVSSSPWNQYDVIDQFLSLQGIPAGPVLLRDWDVGRGMLRHRGHKRERILEIFSTYSGMPFILIGDTTQEDPEIYAELVHEYPGRILAVYIRNVRASAERAAAIATLASEVEKAGSALVLADDSLAAAKHAALHGWIAQSAVDSVREEKREDTGAAPGKEPAAAAAPPPDAPTVVVDPELAEGEKKDIERS